jgi:hypothetical protein
MASLIPGYVRACSGGSNNFNSGENRATELAKKKLVKTNS